MSNVFFNKENLICVDDQWFEKLAQTAKDSDRKVSRLLLHQAPTEGVQEMVIAFTKKCVIPPNKSSGKSESVHVIAGAIVLLQFDDDGELVAQLELAALGNGKPSIFRFSDTPWHTMISRSSVAVVHETLQGPFVPSSAPTPPWVTSSNSQWRNVVAQIQADG